MIERSLNQIIKDALSEDIGSGDITTLATIDTKQHACGEFLVKKDGVIAGLDVVKQILEIFDPSLKLTLFVKDGNQVKDKTIVAKAEGKAVSILTVERTALNFLQRMSGIATMCKLFQDRISHTKAKIIDTRKTVPGLRMIDKLAVKLSGCSNHRIGLYDMFLIKDNHIEAAGSITKAVNLCKKYRKQNKLKYKIEVETTNLKQVKEALDCKVDIIMLDNFNLADMKTAVKRINGKCLVEASGNVNLDTVKSIAETGVDFISVGAITHSVKALDISLELKLIK
ncbi:MAG: carboxylating nicotinate-nucleotide diphosphorylase [Ignavibacteriaceae bacterium]|nr:carboxylating nicotinate-nucleotide diphosphorylase [Ignavibacteriaceae bacterium]